MHRFSSIFERIVDVVLPKRCIGCREFGTFLCFRCSSSLPPATPTKESFVTAIFDYRNPTVKRGIWRFKYENVRELAIPFGEKLYEEIIGDLGEQLISSTNETFLLVPIPLHPRRLRERGYNQSELLARAILSFSAGDFLKLSSASLARVRQTPPQAKKVLRAERLKNLRGAFEANKNVVRGNNIILIDDVATTGATLSEARETLLAAGARSVRAYTVAH